MNKSIIACHAVVIGMLAGTAFAGDMKSGGELFNYHGCVNCHGPDAKNPVSKVVPKLAGKPSDELYEKAKKILSGQGETKESEIMHAAFYSPSACDSPPTDAEIKSITMWISKR